MSKVPNLERLDLSDNYLRSLEKSVFGPASNSLRMIDISNNQIVSLHRNIFASIARLEQLILANNTIPELPDTLFDGVKSSLKLLDLSGNFMTALNQRLVSGLEVLATLDLSRNEIEPVHAQAFAGLKALTFLRLDGNRLSKVPRSLFRQLGNLQKLILSDNALEKRLPGQLLNGMPKLTHLMLDRNLLEQLPGSFFDNTTTLTVLDLSHNRFDTIPEACTKTRLSSLQSLALTGNTVSDLEQLQLPALWRLQVSDNKLTNISATNFRGLPVLKVLDLSSNQISHVARETFKNNQPLQAIRLDSNKLERMDNLFHDLPHLLWLNVSANAISVFDYAMIPKGLSWLDLHQNAIPALGNYFSMEAEFPKLAHIDASFNRLTELGPQNVPNSVELLLLNDNQITTLVPYTFFKKTNLNTNAPFYAKFAPKYFIMKVLNKGVASTVAYVLYCFKVEWY